jgi:FAD linked oxidases, C-terminal domain
VSLDLSQMNRILQVSTGDLDATVEAGVTHEPRRTSQLPFYRRQSLAMPATAILTSALCSIRTILERWRRPNDSTNEWCSGRYRSTALAPVSTASAAARSISWVAEHGEAVSVMRAIKTAIDPDNIMNPGKILRI